MNSTNVKVYNKYSEKKEEKNESTNQQIASNNLL